MNRATAMILVFVLGSLAAGGLWRFTHPFQPNILVIVADDIGVERLRMQNEPHERWPQTPTIDGLAERGLVFGRAYANPLCSSTRAAALTGRYGRRNGAGSAIMTRDRYQVPVDEPNLARVLKSAGYTAHAVGKWHLANTISPSGNQHPLQFGFDSHHGFMQKNAYFHWKRTDDGKPSRSHTYVTRATTDDLIRTANETEGPWFIWAAYQNAHAPIHVPPPALNPRKVTKDSPELEKWHAMIEAMDLELGRALREIRPEVLENTIIIFFGDNGSIARFMPDGWQPSGGKGSLAESGIRVPMVVVGPGVARGRTDALVNLVDLLPTLAELGNATVPGSSTVSHWDDTNVQGDFDGVSFASMLWDPQSPSKRRYSFAESFRPLGMGPYRFDLASIRDERYKLVRAKDGTATFYDLAGRHDDGPALTDLDADQLSARMRLEHVLNAHRKLGRPQTVP